MDHQEDKARLPAEPAPVSIPPTSIERAGDNDVEAQRPVTSEKDGPLTSSCSLPSESFIRQPSPVYLRSHPSSVKRYCRRTQAHARTSKKISCMGAVIIIIGTIILASGFSIPFLLPAILHEVSPLRPSK